jgi:hypothetical protein
LLCGGNADFCLISKLNTRARTRARCAPGRLGTRANCEVWLAYTTLTPIHPHLAVQYQMCVITQLPHVLLLATTLRLNAPTSLPKCVWRTSSLAAHIRCALPQGLLCKTNLPFRFYRPMAAFPTTCKTRKPLNNANL